MFTGLGLVVRTSKVGGFEQLCTVKRKPKLMVAAFVPNRTERQADLHSTCKDQNTQADKQTKK